MFTFSVLKAQYIHNTLPLITVTETAAIKAKPDIAIVVVQINKKVHLNNISSTSDAFLFSREDLQIKFVDDQGLEQSISAIDIDNGGAIFIKHFIITLNEISNLQKLYIDLIKRGFTNISEVYLRLSNIDDLKVQAQKEAFKKSKKKASILADVAGKSLGNVYFTKDLAIEVNDWYNNTKNKKEKSTNNGTYVLNPGNITISATVEVGFEIK